MQNGIYTERQITEKNCSCPKAVNCHECKTQLCSCIEGKTMLVGHFNVIGDGYIIGEVKSCCSCYSKKANDIMLFGAIMQ